MNTLGWVILALVVLVVVVLALYLTQQRRRTGLQERFGSEYDRTVERVGDRKEAESQLSGLAERRDALNVRDLDAAEVAAYRARWEVVQARFVDEPTAAVDDADNLLNTVMRDRGYPVDDFEERAGLISADHPDVVEHYRAAHTAHARSTGSGGVGTEDLRQAFVHYRSLFAELVGPVDSPAQSTTPVADGLAGDAVTDTTDEQIDSDERPRAAHGQEGTR